MGSLTNISIKSLIIDETSKQLTLNTDDSSKTIYYGYRVSLVDF